MTRAAVARRVASGVAIACVLVATLLACGVVLLGSAIAGGFWGTDALTPSSAMDRIAQTTHEHMQMMVGGGILLLIAVSVFVLAALLRNLAWSLAGVAATLMAAAALIGASALSVHGMNHAAVIAEDTFQRHEEAEEEHASDHAPGVGDGSTPVGGSPSLDDVRAEIRDLLDGMVEVGTAPVVTDGGERFDPSTVEISEAVCDGGSRLRVRAAVATGDNGASLPRMVDVWTWAGYTDSIAMQKHILASDTLPIERATLHDRTTIDGLIHLTIDSRCVPRASP